MFAEALAIHLICAGGGSHKEPELATVRNVNDYSQSVTVSRIARSAYEDQVEVEIAGSGGRIRVPAGVKPKIRGGGDDGWWKLKDLEVGTDRIEARFSLNPLNSPKVAIDRRTGAIRIRGRAGDFSGYCEAFDPAAVQRKF